MNYPGINKTLHTLCETLTYIRINISAASLEKETHVLIL